MEAGLVRAQLELYAEEQANMLYRGKDDNSGSVETTTGDATACVFAAGRGRGTGAQGLED